MNTTWTECTPTNKYLDGYEPTLSTYCNIRFAVRTASTFTVTAANMSNLPGIAYITLGSTDYWRVLLDYNGLYDPLTDIYPGLVLKIPDKAALTSILGKTNNSSALTQVTV